jgi:hypothetical protein
MKKLSILFALVVLMSFSTEKKLTVELSVQEWQQVLHVIDQSAASNLDVKSVQKMIVPQLQKQIDTTKK